MWQGHGNSPGVPLPSADISSTSGGAVAEPPWALPSAAWIGWPVAGSHPFPDLSA